MFGVRHDDVNPDDPPAQSAPRRCVARIVPGTEFVGSSAVPLREGQRGHRRRRVATGALPQNGNDVPPLQPSPTSARLPPDLLPTSSRPPPDLCPFPASPRPTPGLSPACARARLRTGLHAPAGSNHSDRRSSRPTRRRAHGQRRLVLRRAVHRARCVRRPGRACRRRRRCGRGRHPVHAGSLDAQRGHQVVEHRGVQAIEIPRLPTRPEAVRRA